MPPLWRSRRMGWTSSPAPGENRACPTKKRPRCGNQKSPRETCSASGAGAPRSSPRNDRRAADHAPDLQRRRLEVLSVRRRPAQPDPSGPQASCAPSVPWRRARRYCSSPPRAASHPSPSSSGSQASLPARSASSTSPRAVTSRQWSPSQATSTAGRVGPGGNGSEVPRTGHVRRPGCVDRPTSVWVAVPDRSVRRSDRGGHHVAECEVVAGGERHPHHAVAGESFVVAMDQQRLLLQFLDGLAGCRSCHASTLHQAGLPGRGASASTWAVPASPSLLGLDNNHRQFTGVSPSPALPGARRETSREALDAKAGLDSRRLVNCELLRWAADAWRSMDALTDPATDCLRTSSAPTWRPPAASRYTSPTYIGGLLWSTVAARELHLIYPAETVQRGDRQPEMVLVAQRAPAAACRSLRVCARALRHPLVVQGMTIRVRCSASRAAHPAGGLRPRTRPRSRRTENPVLVVRTEDNRSTHNFSRVTQ